MFEKFVCLGAKKPFFDHYKKKAMNTFEKFIFLGALVACEISVCCTIMPFENFTMNSRMKGVI
jgi:hypothetical protein